MKGPSWLPLLLPLPLPHRLSVREKLQHAYATRPWSVSPTCRVCFRALSPNARECCGVETRDLDDGFVYVLRDAESDLFKVGFTTTCVADRITSLQTGNPRPLRLVGWRRALGKKDEHTVHQVHEAARVCGEWFRLQMWQVLEILTQAPTDTPDVFTYDDRPGGAPRFVFKGSLIDANGLNKSPYYSFLSDQFDDGAEICPNEIASCRRAVQLLGRMRTSRSAQSSYAWKHTIEALVGEYISNGAFILACLLERVPVKMPPDGLGSVRPLLKPAQAEPSGCLLHLAGGARVLFRRGDSRGIYSADTTRNGPYGRVHVPTARRHDLEIALQTRSPIEAT